MDDYFTNLKSKFDFAQIQELLDKIKNFKVLIIGDTIIDHYLFSKIKGRAIKDPILSVEYVSREVYAGGILAIAKHVANFVNSIKLVTLLGDFESKEEFVRESLPENVLLKAFYKPNSPTTVKKRILDNHRGNKLFKIEYINDRPLPEDVSNQIISYLDSELQNYDLVIVGDFGHGFINEAIRRKLEEKSKFLAINVQTNSANMGFNYNTLYKRFDFLTMNEDELRLPQSMQYHDIKEVIDKAAPKFKDHFLVTVGKRGSLWYEGGKLYSAPILINSVKDTVGAGDALFAIASLFVHAGATKELVPFIANCAGGIGANTMGNKESVTKSKLLNFIEGVYENGMGRI